MTQETTFAESEAFRRGVEAMRQAAVEATDRVRAEMTEIGCAEGSLGATFARTAIILLSVKEPAP